MPDWRPHEESNLDLRFRKPLFYPLNYGDGAFRCQFVVTHDLLGYNLNHAYSSE